MLVDEIDLHLHPDWQQRVLDDLLADGPAMGVIERVPGVLAGVVRAGGKILICGNGGSACDANHFAEELTGRFRKDRPPIAAIACTDVGHVTCFANDYGFEHVFARWVGGLGRAGDALIVLSTSGNSVNTRLAIEAGKKAGMTTVALLGTGGGGMGGWAEHEVVVPGVTSDRIQELHMLVLHGWCHGLEVALGWG
jgi:D-sedoheptulose 7-phosphate isomerase